MGFYFVLGINLGIEIGLIRLGGKVIFRIRRFYILIFYIGRKLEDINY